MRTKFCLLVVSLLSALPFSAWAEYEPWPEEAVELFAKTPLLHEGRVQPFQTLATDTLFELSARTKLKTKVEGTDHKLSSTAWLMDVFFRPEVAKDFQDIIVEDKNAVIAVGVDPDSFKPKKKKRDRYSYNELFADPEVRRKLSQRTQDLQKKQQRIDQQKKLGKEVEKLTALEEQTLQLGRRIFTFESMMGATIPVVPDSHLSLDSPLSKFLEGVPAIGISQIEGLLNAGPQALGEDGARWFPVFQKLYIMYRTSDGVTFFPPKDPEEEAWLSVSDLIEMALSKEGEERTWAVSRLAALEDLATTVGDMGQFQTHLDALYKLVGDHAAARGETKSIPYEMSYNDDPFLVKPRMFFVFGVVLILVSWLFAQNNVRKYLTWGAVAVASLGFIYLVKAMTLRVLIRGWAPVTNLYETFLLIAAGGFLFGLLFEFFTRKRIVLAAGILLPAICLFLAIQFRESNPSDNTLPPLEAVLRSNFWLSTHVIIITLGYCAGLLAALLSNFWILARFFGWEVNDRKNYRELTGITYGIVLFSLLFSLVGTVLGGIWANYSWGRFWGWDPKENGALMIVLWTLVILHARLGGYIRDLGIHVMTVILGCIISFSWFGVNAMGVGLHSYGFLGGIWRALCLFWIIEAVVLAMAYGLKLRGLDNVRGKDRELIAKG